MTIKKFSGLVAIEYYAAQDLVGGSEKYGAVAPDQYSNRRIDTLSCSTAGFPDAIYFVLFGTAESNRQQGPGDFVRFDSNVASIQMNVLGETITMNWLGDPSYRYQGAQVGIRDLFLANAGTLQSYTVTYEDNAPLYDYRPDPRPTGVNNKINPYYARENNVRISKSEYNKQVFL